MDETLNTVNDVQEGIVDLPETGTDGTGVSAESSESAEQEAPEAAEPAQVKEKPLQTPEQNAWFAAQRRAAQEAAQEAARAKAENERLLGALHGYGYQGSPQDIADQLEAAAKQITVEQVRAQRAEVEKKAQEALRQSPEFLRLQAERDALSQMAAETVFRQDLSAINKAFPDAKVKSIDEIGPQFQRLRAAGIDTLTAYAAVRQAKEAVRKPAPPSMGAVNASSSKEKDFYTPDEVDRLSDKELDDPKVWQRVRKSMTRWK